MRPGRGDADVLFAETKEVAAQLSAAALERLRANGVAPTPEHYTVWYAHFSGRFPALSRAIDILETNQAQVGEAHCADLYERFFGMEAEHDAVHVASEKLGSALESVMAALREAGADVGRYHDVLATARGQLDLAATLEQLKALVRSVADETARMARNNQALEAQLSESAVQIESMRHDLAVVRQEALTDALTGIANRKRFDQVLRAAAGQAMESGRPLALAMIDIDRFKLFNDTHGHVAGDQVLRLVARTLADSVRGSDTPSRFGGEEFALVMPDTPLTAGVSVAERIRRATAGRQIVKRTSGESMGSITLSAGVAIYRPGETLAAFVQRADAALYAAKAGGRNRVVADAADFAAQPPEDVAAPDPQVPGRAGPEKGAASQGRATGTR